MDQKAAGIPYYWDDVAGSFSEYFTAGSRDLSQGMSPRVNQLAQSVGGLTKGGQVHIVDPINGAPAAFGDFVAIDNAVVKNWTTDSADGFLVKNKEVMSRDDTYIRISRNNETGGAQAELVRLVTDPEEARILTDMFDKDGFYRTDGKKVPRPGMNRLDGTDGAQLVSMPNKPQEVVPVDRTKAVAQQVSG